VVHRASSEFHERLTTRARGSGAVMHALRRPKGAGRSRSPA
jgi:hypothetical protein